MRSPISDRGPRSGFTRSYPALALLAICGILWGNGILLGNNLVLEGTSLMDEGVTVGTWGLMSLTASTWYGKLVDPASMQASTAEILCLGEAGKVPALRTGAPGAWFYPSAK